MRNYMAAVSSMSSCRVVEGRQRRADEREEGCQVQTAVLLEGLESRENGSP